MITFTHATARYTCSPEKAPALRAILDSGKFPKLKMPADRKHDSARRDYPVYGSEMTTGDYVAAYARLNERLKLAPLDIAPAIDRVHARLDPTQPEVLEDIDLDYVPTAAPVKKQTVASLKAAIARALEALDRGDIDAARAALE